MTTYADADGVVIESSPLEERAGIASLEALQAKRRQIIEANAHLIAMHGPFGHYDDHRKRMVECQKTRVRMDLSGKEGKVTEAMIEQSGYASEAYGQWLDNALTEKVEYLRVQAELDDVNEQIRSREEELRVYGKELAVGR